MSKKLSVVLVLVVSVLIMGTGTLAIDEVMDEDMQEYMDDSAEWCEERGGELFNARVIGKHGGLHCKFENGTTVHMREVIDRE